MFQKSEANVNGHLTFVQFTSPHVKCVESAQHGQETSLAKGSRKSSMWKNSAVRREFAHNRL